MKTLGCLLVLLALTASGQPPLPPSPTKAVKHAATALAPKQAATAIVKTAVVQPPPTTGIYTNTISVIVTNWSAPWLEVIWSSDDAGKNWHHNQVNLLTTNAPFTNTIILDTNAPPSRWYEITIEPAITRSNSVPPAN